jgi:hypothetical protein
MCTGRRCTYVISAGGPAGAESRLTAPIRPAGLLRYDGLFAGLSSCAALPATEDQSMHTRGLPTQRRLARLPPRCCGPLVAARCDRRPSAIVASCCLSRRSTRACIKAAQQRAWRRGPPARPFFSSPGPCAVRRPSDIRSLVSPASLSLLASPAPCIVDPHRYARQPALDTRRAAHARSVRAAATHTHGCRSPRRARTCGRARAAPLRLGSTRARTVQEAPRSLPW